MTEQIIFDCDNTMGLPRKEVDDGAHINMPSRILAPERFRAILLDAWRQTKAGRTSGGR